jgi:hypothetical protein
MAPALGAPIAWAVAKGLDLHLSQGVFEFILGPLGPLVGALVVFFPVFWLLRRHMKKHVERLEEAIETATHHETRNAARARERGIHLLELVELLLQEVELRQSIVKKVGLDPEILQHLLKLANSLGDVLSVDGGNTLCSSGRCKGGGQRQGRGTGGKETGKAPDHRKVSKVKSMYSRSNPRAAAMAICSSLRGWVWAALIRVRIATSRASSARA